MGRSLARKARDLLAYQANVIARTELRAAGHSCADCKHYETRHKAMRGTASCALGADTGGEYQPVKHTDICHQWESHS
jgi:hypothetical protein